MKKGLRLKGSYTVEGAWIFGICLIITFSAMVFSFRLYEKVYTYVEETSVNDIDAVGTFRLICAGQEVISK